MDRAAQFYLESTLRLSWWGNAIGRLRPSIFGQTENPIYPYLACGAPGINRTNDRMAWYMLYTCTYGDPGTAMRVVSL